MFLLSRLFFPGYLRFISTSCTQGIGILRKVFAKIDASPSPPIGETKKKGRRMAAPYMPEDDQKW